MEAKSAQASNFVVGPDFVVVVVVVELGFAVVALDPIVGSDAPHNG